MINCVRAKNLLDEVELSIKSIKRFKSASALEKSYLAKFLVVYICGIYEEAIECILNDRVIATGSTVTRARFGKFFEKYTRDHFRNPNVGNVAHLLGLFDNRWRDAIMRLPDVAKIAFNSIAANKNLIAHGSQCNITLDEVVNFYKHSKKVIKKVDSIVKF